MRFDALRSGQSVRATSLVDDAQAWLVHPSGVEDPEAADRSRLQGVLSRLQGEPRLEALDDRLRAASDWPGLRRLRELRDPSTDHSWMNCLHAAHGPVLDADSYVDALRVRFGVPFLPDDAECALCGGLLDRRCVHPQTCAQAESTRGHYRVCSRVYMVAALGLIPSVLRCALPTS